MKRYDTKEPSVLVEDEKGPLRLVADIEALRSAAREKILRWIRTWEGDDAGAAADALVADIFREGEK